jgi:hypothetical protein
MKVRTTIVSVFAAVTMASTAFAQQSDDGSCEGAASNSGVHQTFCFRPEAVRGSLVGATGQTVRPLRGVRGESLLRIRAHFVPEMMKSVERL